MLSKATLKYFSTQPDVNDKYIDELVEYAATERPDAWLAIKVMHECCQDSIIPHYLMQLNDEKLTALGNILPSLWERIEAIQEQIKQQQAMADTQPEALQQQASDEEMMNRVTLWFRKQDHDVCMSTVCRAIEVTVKAGMVRCKQDWAGILRLIRDDGKWFKKLTNKAFIQMVTANCHLKKEELPTEPTIKVLSFEDKPFPAWRVSGYQPQQMKSLMQMVTHLLRQIDNQVQQAMKNRPITSFSI